MIYLDYAASTPLHPELQDMLPDVFLKTGNAQSQQMNQIHQKIIEAKQKICQYFHGNPDRLFMTSGATESINTALIGAANFYSRSGKHLITFETEHQAVLKTFHYLKTQGFEISILPVLPHGEIDITRLKQEIRPDTTLISLNHLCNETGLIHNLTPLQAIRQETGVMLHLDACQSIGKSELDLRKTPIDFMSLSAHKSYGPQGVGALYLAENRHVQPIIHGSHPVRSGTISHALTTLMGASYAIAKRDYVTNQEYINHLRQLFLSQLSVEFYAHEQHGAPHIINICFPNATADAVNHIQKHIACQTSSACFKGAASHVLTARRIPLHHILRSIRFSLGVTTTEDDISQACNIINRLMTK